MGDNGKSIVVSLLSSRPLALIIIGILIMGIVAAGGFQWSEFSLKFDEVFWRIGLAIPGVILLSIGIFFLFWKQDKDPKPIDYGVKIRHPPQGYTESYTGPTTNEGYYEQKIPVSGTYERKPNEKLRLFIYAHRKHWLQLQQVNLDEAEKTWHGEVLFQSPFRFPIIIQVFSIGKNGQILCEYYENVAKTLRRPVGLDELTPDMHECDRTRISVIRDNYEVPDPDTLKYLDELFEKGGKPNIRNPSELVR